jgi:hypothetical protein
LPLYVKGANSVSDIAMSIPDFEGEAVLRIFSNTTQSQIGCFSAVVTNGNSFSQPESVGSVLGIFTFVAFIASIATAIYGDDIPVMRKHYAHSLSLLVVFAVFHHIFFTGALSMNWPSVLVAWWSNFAWTAGMINTKSMQDAISKFVGTNIGNTTSVGAASVGSANEGLGGGYDIHKIYARGEVLNVPGLMKRARHNLVARALEDKLMKRDLANSSEGFSWYGNALRPGLPLPGNYSGFAGTLAQETIPASNAFLTGFIWLLILILIVAGMIFLAKWGIEGLTKMKLARSDRLTFFRTHWLKYISFAILRTFYIAFFMMMVLTMFQFTYGGGPGMLAIAAIVFVGFLVGMFGIAGYACFYRIKVGNYVSKPDRLNLERRRILKVIPWYNFSRQSEHLNETEKIYAGSVPIFRLFPADPSTAKSIHEDEDYAMKFGWLVSRFRKSRWWFFSAWLTYEFIRACFFGAAAGHPLIQVFGLLVVEFIAFIAIIILKPFEGQRLNALLVYCLGFSKVTTVALSAAFDNRFNLARIPCTVIGIVIIVIQGILTILLLVAIILGACTSWMSVMRNREDFRPRKWAGIRVKYFKHLDAPEKDTLPSPEPINAPVRPEGPYFNVNSFRRMPKVEDEDAEFMQSIRGDPRGSQISLKTFPTINEAADAPPTRASRAASIYSNMSSTNLPWGARVHRASWSSRDFNEWSNSERRRTVSSVGPMLSEVDGNRTGSQLSLNARFNSSRENLSRLPSPLTSRPHSPTAAGGIHRPKSRTLDTVSPLSPLSRPTLETVPSANEVERIASRQEEFVDASQKLGEAKHESTT